VHAVFEIDGQAEISLCPVSVKVSALMKHVFQQLQRSKPSQRHKLLLDLHTQTPTPLKLALNRVSHTSSVSHRSLLQWLTAIAFRILQV